MGMGLDLELLDPEESKWIDALPVFPSSDNNLRDDPLGISNLMDYYPSTRSSSKQEIAEEENDSNNIFL